MRISIKVIPRSTKSEVVGVMSDGTLKVKLTTAPVDGKANEALLTILSNHFSCQKNQLRIVTGKTSSRKVVELN